MSGAEPTVPFACVRSHPGGGTTMFARCPASDEFLFECGDAAVAFYKEGKTLRVCSACATVHEAKKAREMGGAEPGVAVRGLGGTQ